MREREKERERERERDCTVFANKSFVWLGFLEYWVVTTASDEDPKPKLIVRISFCTAKSDIPTVLMLCLFV